jgi:hypothetical protein
MMKKAEIEKQPREQRLHLQSAEFQLPEPVVGSLLRRDSLKNIILT